MSSSLTSRSNERVVLELYPGTEEEPHELEADNPKTHLMAWAYKLDGSSGSSAAFSSSNPLVPGTPLNGTPIIWRVLPQQPATGWKFERKDTVVKNGMAEAVFKGSRKSGDTFIIEAELPEYRIKARSGLFKIVPGVTGFIYVDSPTDKPRMPVPGEKMHVVVQLKDRFGNVVRPGTTVDWYDYGATGIEINPDTKRPYELDKKTNSEGKAAANFLVAPMYEGNFPNNGPDVSVSGFIVESAGFRKEYIFDFSPITVELDILSPNPDGSLDVATSQTGLLTVTCRHQNGNNVADGTKVAWMTTNGAIQNPQLTLQGGQAQAVLSASGGRRGQAVVKVLIGESTGLGTYGMVPFTSSAVASMDINPRVPDSGQSVTVDVYGPPGGTATMPPAVVDVYAISYTFKPPIINSQIGLVQPDDIFYHPAKLIGNPEKSEEPGTYASDPSMRLHGDGDCLTASPIPSIQIANSLMLSMWFKPVNFPATGQAMTLLERHGQYRLFLFNDGAYRIGFHAIGGSSLIAVVSDPLPADPDFSLVATYVNGLASLTVNGQIKEAAGAGLIPLNSAPLVIGAITNDSYAPVGEYFDGYVDDVKVAVRVVIPGVMGLSLGAGGHAQLAIPPIPTFDQPDDTPPINWNRTVTKVRIAITVHGPPEMPVEVELEENLFSIAQPHARNTKAVISDIKNLGSQFYDALMEFGLARHEIETLAELAYNGVWDYKQTALPLAKIILTYSQYLPGAAAWIPLLNRTGKSSYVLARMLRVAILTHRFAALAVLGELIGIIGAAATEYLDRLDLVAPSESGLYDLLFIQDNYEDPTP